MTHAIMAWGLEAACVGEAQEAYALAARVAAFTAEFCVGGLAALVAGSTAVDAGALGALVEVSNRRRLCVVHAGGYAALLVPAAASAGRGLCAGGGSAARR